MNEDFKQMVKYASISCALFILFGLGSATSCGMNRAGNSFEEGFFGILFFIFWVAACLAGFVATIIIVEYYDRNKK